MAKWYEYRVNQPNNGELSGIMRRLAEIEKRQAAFEQRLAFVERRPVANADQAHTPYTWGDGAGDPYYHRQDLAGSVGEAAHKLAPWVSTSVRFAESLTSVGHVKAMALQALLMGASAGSVGGLVAWRAELPVLATAGGVAIASFALTFSTLLVINRGDIHALVRQQGVAAAKRRQDLHIQVDKVDERGHKTVDFLLVSGITLEQLWEFAPQALRAESLAVNVMAGGGKLFSQPQYQALVNELITMGYARRPASNKAPELTNKGRALFRALQET